MKGSRPAESRLFDADVFKTKAREGLVVPLRKELVAPVSQLPSSVDDDPRLNFVLSTAAVDRSGDTISQSGWDVTSYLKNPVMLWAHDGSCPPVGKAPTGVLVETDPATREQRLVARGVQFTPRELNAEGWAVGQMYLKGFLNAVSVGFLPKTYNFNDERGAFAVDFQSQELLEFSAVPVPANPEALIGAKAAGIPIEWVQQWAEKILDGAKPTADGWSPPSRKYVEQLRAVVAPKTFQVPRTKDDADAQADAMLLEALAGVEASLSAQRAALDANTAALMTLTAAIANAAEPDADDGNEPKPSPPSQPAGAAAPVAVVRFPSREEIAAATRAEVAKQVAALTGRST